MPAPVLFVSHGAPDIILQTGSPTLKAWENLGATLPRPAAILVISAHWNSATPTLSISAQPDTIHDFGGFPRALYQLQYPAPGAPQLQGQVQAALQAAGIPLELDAGRGLDHGAWIPLSSLYPQADIPVAQLAIQPYQGSVWHYSLGQALQTLRTQNILLLASGAVTHNFAWLADTSTPHTGAAAFSGWLAEQVAARNTENLLAYRNTSATGAASHPTEEHLLPLFVAYGASTADDRLTYLSPEFTYGALAMDAYCWGAEMADNR